MMITMIMEHDAKKEEHDDHDAKKEEHDHEGHG